MAKFVNNTKRLHKIRSVKGCVVINPLAEFEIDGDHPYIKFHVKKGDFSKVEAKKTRAKVVKNISEIDEF